MAIFGVDGGKSGILQNGFANLRHAEVIAFLCDVVQVSLLR